MKKSRRILWPISKGGDTAMLIWLGVAVLQSTRYLNQFGDRHETIPPMAWLVFLWIAIFSMIIHWALVVAVRAVLVAFGRLQPKIKEEPSAKKAA